jgi:cytochrome c2
MTLQDPTIMTKIAFSIPAVAAVAAVCLAMSAQCANAQSATKNAATGQALAQEYCAECHMVVPSSKAGWTDAPAFLEIANRQGTTEAKLKGFIQKPHMHMLNTGRPPHEADEISAYIMSLRKS